MRTIQQVAKGTIDLVTITDKGSYKIANVMVTNVDTLAAQFTVAVQGCFPAQVSPPTIIFSL